MAMGQLEIWVVGEETYDMSQSGHLCMNIIYYKKSLTISSPSMNGVRN